MGFEPRHGAADAHGDCLYASGLQDERLSDRASA